MSDREAFFDMLRIRTNTHLNCAILSFNQRLCKAIYARDRKGRTAKESDVFTDVLIQMYCARM